MGVKAKLVRIYRQGHSALETIPFMFEILALDGGPGSGNFGHNGRPGKVGGSGKGGGSAFRTTTSEGKYIGVQRAEAFRGIKKVAQKAKDARDFINNLSKEQRDMVSAQYRQSGSKERIWDYTERLRQLMSSQKPEKTVAFKITNGSDKSQTCSWNGKPYKEPMFGQMVDTEIEHVIVQQGFNGPPKVLSQEEFLAHVEQHPEMPVLFRSYAALGEEAVQAYDDMLENGEWYVDCSNGGAQYGQGMYCAGVYGNNDYSTALSEMQHYRHVSMENARARWTPALADGEDCVKVDGKNIVFRPDQMQKVENSTPPNASDVIAMVKGSWSPETVKGYFMPADPEDNDSPLEFTYYTDYDGWKTVPVENVPYWGPIDRTEVAPAPAASTRMMTLDPSAKIITYKDAELLFDGKMTKDQRKALYQEKVDNLAKELKSDPAGLTDDEQYLIVYTSKIGLDLFTPEDQKKYIEICKRIDDDRRKELMDEGSELGHSFFQEVRDAEQAQASRTKEIRARYHNIGSYMAALGYDAINAEGHGSTDSYTVVLNRTKLILNQSRIDVA